MGLNVIIVSPTVSFWPYTCVHDSGIAIFTVQSALFTPTTSRWWEFKMHEHWCHNVHVGLSSCKSLTLKLCTNRVKPTLQWMYSQEHRLQHQMWLMYKIRKYGPLSLFGYTSMHQGCSTGNHGREIPGNFPFPGKQEGKAWASGIPELWEFPVARETPVLWETPIF